MTEFTNLAPTIEDTGQSITVDLGSDCRFDMVGESAAWLRRRRGGGFHEPTLARILLELAKSGRAGAFFDIGALHGYFSLMVASATRGTRPVHGFEMNPESAKHFRNGVAANATKDPSFNAITVRNAAVGARNEKRETVVSGFRLDRDGSKGQAVDLRFISIDHYCQRQQVTPAFMKIDIEGWEGAALMGMSRLIRTASPVIAMELHSSEMLAPTGMDRVSVMQMMLTMGYRCYAFSDHRGDTAATATEILDPGHTPEEAKFAKQRDSLVVMSRDPIEAVVPGVLGLRASA